MSLNGTKLSKHDRYVEELYTKIKDRYDSVSKHVAVRAKKRMLAEVDVLAKKGDSVDLYEVKCSHRPIKAKKQLSRLRRLLGGFGDSKGVKPESSLIKMDVKLGFRMLTGC